MSGDWSSDVCSSDLEAGVSAHRFVAGIALSDLRSAAADVAPHHQGLIPLPASLPSAAFRALQSFENFAIQVVLT